MPSSAVYIVLAAARSETGCRTVLTPSVVVMSLMVTPSSLGTEQQHFRAAGPRASVVTTEPTTESSTDAVRQDGSRGAERGDLDEGIRGVGAGRTAPEQRRDRVPAVHLRAYG